MDIRQIKNLVELMVENDLAELEIQQGETHIVLKRGRPGPAGGAPPFEAYASSPAAVPPDTATAATEAAPTAANPSPAADTAQPTQEATEVYIRSPMVGTFYASPDPESPPFVKVGDIVRPDTVVCLVEAMKVFNEIKAEVSGRLTRALVRNADAVEYDQPLFAVAPA